MPPSVSEFASLTYYQRLGVPASASPKRIQQAYRTLSKRYHPDLAPFAPEVAIRLFQDLQEAYSVLSNPQQRAMYDATLWLRDPEAWQQLVAYRSGTVGSPPYAGTELEQDPQSIGLGADPILETRPLSAGEIFALVVMVATFVGCLLLVGVVAWIRAGDLA